MLSINLLVQTSFSNQQQHCFLASLRNPKTNYMSQKGHSLRGFFSTAHNGRMGKTMQIPLIDPAKNRKSAIFRMNKAFFVKAGNRWVLM